MTPKTQSVCKHCRLLLFPQTADSYLPEYMKDEHGLIGCRGRDSSNGAPPHEPEEQEMTDPEKIANTLDALILPRFRAAVAEPASTGEPPGSGLMDCIGDTLRIFEAWQCERTEVATDALADHLDRLGALYVAAGGELK